MTENMKWKKTMSMLQGKLITANNKSYPLFIGVVMAKEFGAFTVVRPCLIVGGCQLPCSVKVTAAICKACAKKESRL